MHRNLRDGLSAKRQFKYVSVLTLRSFKSGRMVDFLDHGKMDPMLFVDRKRSYYRFLEGYEPEYAEALNEDEQTIIEFLSRNVANGMRPHELLELRCIANGDTVYGYRIKHGSCPIFVTYNKQEDIASSTQYEDQFIDPDAFSWMTRSRVTLESSEAQQIINAQENGLELHLFAKKSDSEGGDFYYLGPVVPKSWRQTTIRDDAGRGLPIVNFILQMETTVKDDIYEYFTGDAT